MTFPSLAADNIQKTLQDPLKALGLHVGHTVHGARRGKMQHLEDNEGMSRAEIGARVGIKTDAIVDRYLDRERHEPRQDRWMQQQMGAPAGVVLPSRVIALPVTGWAPQGEHAQLEGGGAAQ